ncbi:MAG: hypothetical protein AAGJ29_07160 [Pseudomonadota bacterium]
MIARRQSQTAEKLSTISFNPADRASDAWRRAERFFARRKRAGSVQADICHARLILNGEMGGPLGTSISGGLLLYKGWGGDRVMGAGLVELPPDRMLAHMPTEIDMFSRYPWLSAPMKRLLIGGQLHALRRLTDFESFNMPFRLDERRSLISGIPSSRDLVAEIRELGAVTPAMEPLYVEYATHMMRTRDFGILSIGQSTLLELERDYMNWKSELLAMNA